MGHGGGRLLVNRFGFSWSKTRVGSPIWAILAQIPWSASPFRRVPGHKMTVIWLTKCLRQCRCDISGNSPIRPALTTQRGCRDLTVI